MPEKIPVEDIESLNLENGILLIDDGLVKQIYENGKFSVVSINDSGMASTLDNNDEYIDYDLGNLNYFNFNIFFGSPIYFRPSLLDGNNNPSSLPNIGLSFNLPYFAIGPFNMSAGAKILTIGFDKNFNESVTSDLDPKKIKSITIATNLYTDLTPILGFLPENMNIGTEGGVTYSLGWEEDYSGGLGILVGGTIDYWFDELPLYLRFFGNGIMIPNPVEGMTGFGNIGLALGLVLKRD